MGGYLGRLRGRCTSRLLSLDDVLAALGDDGVDSRRRDEVPLADVVGSVNRGHDFDEDFRPITACVRDRRKSLAAAVLSGFDPPAVELVQVGDLYFVVDGHHRVSVARSLGRDTISARVLRVCTTAYGVCHLRPALLATKTAERRFLERVPLAVGLRCRLWLDCPDDWDRLADAAEAWGFRYTLATGRVLDRCELAHAWWAEEVLPVVGTARRRRSGDDRRDIQVYADAHAARGGCVQGGRDVR
ncbi:MAG: hypothetical protein M3211_01635 [Actinomycetota bacterium]|nr:hypothetical protein [Actinomycetota bacterium]